MVSEANHWDGNGSKTISFQVQSAPRRGTGIEFGAQMKIMNTSVALSRFQWFAALTTGYPPTLTRVGLKRCRNFRGFDALAHRTCPNSRALRA